MYLPNFRDWYVLPYYPLVFDNKLEIAIIDKTLMNLWVNVGGRADIGLVIYSLFWVVVGGYLSLFYFKRILLQYLFIIPKPQLTILTMLFYVINPWTIERLLMGQINVLRGHLLLLPVLYYLLKYFRYYTLNKLLLSSTVLLIYSLISIHHVYILLGLTLIIGLKRFILGMDGGKDGLRMSLVQFSKLIVFAPALLVEYISNLNLYSTSILELTYSSRIQIIKAFSLKNNSWFDIYTLSITGFGSWMNASFEEVKVATSFYKIDYNWFVFVNILFWVLILVLTVLHLFLNRAKIKLTSNFSKFLILLILIFILNLGIQESGIVGLINTEFHAFPFNYILREGGKAYSFWLVITMFLIHQLKQYQHIIKVLLSLVLVCNFVFLLIIIPALNFSTSPQILNTLKSTCENGKVLVLPYDNYIISGRSNGVFEVNSWSERSSCEFIIPTTTKLATSKDQYLFQDKLSIRIEEFVNTSSICEIKHIQDLLLKFKIKYILIDNKYYPKLIEFEDCLSRFLELIDSKETIKLYQIQKEK